MDVDNLTLTSLPSEIKLDIFGYLPDAESIISLRQAGRAFNQFYFANTRSILKRVLATIGGDFGTLQLAFMALRSNLVDYRERRSVESFLDQFFRDALPDWAYTLRGVRALSSIVTAAESLSSIEIQHPQTAVIDNFSTTERRRICRALYAMEIGGRVFHGRPGALGRVGFRFRAPFPDLERKYWMAFSKGEISQLFVADLIMERALMEAVYDEGGCPTGGIRCCAENNARRFFSQTIGIKRLATWNMGNCLIGSDTESYISDVHDEIAQYKSPNFHGAKSIERIAREIHGMPPGPVIYMIRNIHSKTEPWDLDFAEISTSGPDKVEDADSRFADDAEDMSDETWDWTRSEWRAFFDDRGKNLNRLRDDRCSSRFLPILDRETLTKLRDDWWYMKPS